MSDEIWRHIAGERDCYEVSNFGRVRNTKTNHIRSPTLASHGYYVVGFKHDNKQRLRYVHDLVAIAFIGEKPAGFTVNHIDGVKTNNKPINLEIVSQRENMLHAHRTRLCDNRGHRHGMSTLSESDVRSIVSQLGSGISDGAIGRRFNVGAEAIRRIRVGKGWRHITGL